MDHRIMNEKLKIYFFEEITTKDKTEIESHLNECQECREALEELKRLRTFLSMKKQDIPDRMLTEARQELRARLRIERKRKTIIQGLKEILFSGSLKPVYALSGLAVFAAGLLLGYIIFRSNGMIGDDDMVTAAEQQSDIKINNVKFIDSDASDGEVEFTFDAIKPVRVKGNLSDDKIKSVLMHAMLNEENPGVRLNTVNFMNAATSLKIDSEVKAAILTVAKYDENPGVRREAFSFIKKLPYDKDIKSAYLYVLMNDSVSGLRIEAINGLFAAAQKGEMFTNEELSVFREKMKADENSYIRLRAQTVLMEYK